MLPDLRPSVADYGKARVDAGQVAWVGSARKFELWESSRALTVGLGAATQYALDIGLPAIWARITRLGGLLADQLSTVSGVQVYRGGARQAGIVGFTVNGTSAGCVRDYLHRRGVAVTLSTSLGSPVAMQRLGVQGLVRASVHYYNTEDDIDALIEILGNITGRRSR